MRFVVAFAMLVAGCGDDVSEVVDAPYRAEVVRELTFSRDGRNFPVQLVRVHRPDGGGAGSGGGNAWAVAGGDDISVGVHVCDRVSASAPRAGGAADRGGIEAGAGGALDGARRAGAR